MVLRRAGAGAAFMGQHPGVALVGVPVRQIVSGFATDEAWGHATPGGQATMDSFSHLGAPSGSRLREPYTLRPKLLCP